MGKLNIAAVEYVAICNEKTPSQSGYSKVLVLIIGIVICLIQYVKLELSNFIQDDRGNKYSRGAYRGYGYLYETRYIEFKLSEIQYKSQLTYYELLRFSKHA